MRALHMIAYTAESVSLGLRQMGAGVIASLTKYMPAIKSNARACVRRPAEPVERANLA